MLQLMSQETVVWTEHQATDQMTVLNTWSEQEGGNMGLCVTMFL